MKNVRPPIVFLVPKSKSDYQTISNSFGPRRWENFITEYADSRKISIRSHLKIADFLSKDVITISYGPTLKSVFLALLGVKCVYVHWGVKKSSNYLLRLIRKLRYWLIFKFSSIVLVNDDVSREEVIGLCSGVPVEKFFYPVDTAYFERIKKLYNDGDLSDAYLMPGNAFRDDLLAYKISQNGVRITRALQDERLYHEIKRLNGPSYKVRYNLEERELFQLMLKSKGIILPMADGGSASGQHVILEAIALEKHIFISSNRISLELRDCPYVHIVESRDPNIWTNEIDSTLNRSVRSACRPCGSGDDYVYNHSQKVFNKFIDTVIERII